jgi:hypothetical protein
MFACVCKARHLKISEREKTLWASRSESVEINISREKEFIILIIKNILERVSGFFTDACNDRPMLYKFGICTSFLNMEPKGISPLSPV